MLSAGRGGAGVEAEQPGEAIVVDDDFHSFYHEGKWTALHVETPA